MLRTVLQEISQKFEGPDHLSRCDGSCPNCLRSWDNRRIHSALNWRLALDMSELALGQPLSTDRWLKLAPRLVADFVAGFGAALGDVEVVEAAGLPALLRRRASRAVLLGHPLWQRKPQRFNDQQAEAYHVLEAQGMQSIEVRDLYVLFRAQFSVFRDLR